MRIKLDYVWQPKAKGRTYTYYRRDRQQQRIAGEPGSAAFFADYQRIHATFEKPSQQPATRPGSLKALIEDYKTTKKYLSKKPRTKKIYLLYLGVLEQDYGGLTVCTMPTPFVVALRDKYQDTPRTANGYVQIMSILMKRAHNPAQGVELLDTGEGHRAWDEDEISAFRAQWQLGTLQRTAFELALNTGQRGSGAAIARRWSACISKTVSSPSRSRSSAASERRPEVSGRLLAAVTSGFRSQTTFARRWLPGIRGNWPGLMIVSIGRSLCQSTST
jgi:hypothetical protein